jgi:hypothetical protein
MVVVVAIAAPSPTSLAYPSRPSLHFNLITVFGIPDVAPAGVLFLVEGTLWDAQVSGGFLRDFRAAFVYLSRDQMAWHRRKYRRDSCIAIGLVVVGGF